MAGREHWKIFATMSEIETWHCMTRIRGKIHYLHFYSSNVLPPLFSLNAAVLFLFVWGPLPFLKSGRTSISPGYATLSMISRFLKTYQSHPFTLHFAWVLSNYSSTCYFLISGFKSAATFASSPLCQCIFSSLSHFSLGSEIAVKHFCPVFSSISTNISFPFSRLLSS